VVALDFFADGDSATGVSFALNFFMDDDLVRGMMMLTGQVAEGRLFQQMWRVQRMKILNASMKALCGSMSVCSRGWSTLASGNNV
jgi:hypothetical protein